MVGWKDSGDEEKVFSGASDILRLAMVEGKYTLRIISTYKFFRVHWFNGIKRSANCSTTNCPVCNAGEKGQLRYVVNIIDRADGKVKLWEFGRRVKVSIQNIAEDYNLDEYDLIVRRTGMGMEDTVYTVLPAPNAKPLTEEEKKLPKYDLEKLYAPTPLEKVTSFMQGKIPAQAPRTETRTQQTQVQQPIGGDDLPVLS